jgi:hypothetical protein
LKPGESVRFRYLVLVASGEKLDDEEMNKLAEKFSKR